MKMPKTFSSGESPMGAGPAVLLDAMGRPAGGGFSASASFAAAAAAYLANDAMGGVQAFQLSCGTVKHEGGDVWLLSALLELDAAALVSTEGAYQLALFGVTPPTVIADNDAFQVVAANRPPAFLTRIDLGTPLSYGGGTMFSPVDNINRIITVPASGILYGILITVAAFTAVVSTRKVYLHTGPV